MASPEQPLKEVLCAHPAAFVLDVDGVMTDGKSVYTEAGKVMKVFGPDDHDSLNLLRDTLEIRFVSADRRGFPISRARIERDMGFPIDLVSSADRLAWITERWPGERVIYMGDGPFDRFVFEGVGYGISVADADADTLAAADYVTSRRGGDRAVSEASKHVLDRFFGGARAKLEAAASGRAVGVTDEWSEHDAA